MIHYKQLLPDPDLYRTNRENNLRVARITRIDYEEMVMDINWVDGGGAYYKIPITFPGKTLRATIALMPEVGSLVICGFIPHINQKKKPVPLAYLPDYAILGLTGEPVITRSYPQQEHIRTKYRKLYPGEILLSSTQGSDIILDNNIQLINPKNNEITLRGSDQTLIINTLLQYLKSAGIELKSGIAYRNRIFNTGIADDGTILVDPEFEDKLPPFTVLSDGRLNRPIPTKSIKKDDNTKEDNRANPLLTEYRLKIQDSTIGTIAVNTDINGQPVDETDEEGNELNYNPTVDISYGNLIGDDFAPEGGRELYAQPLKFNLFKDDRDITGNPMLQPIPENNNIAEENYKTQGQAIYMAAKDKQKHNFVLSANKQGNAHLFCGGIGRSLDVLLNGGTKWVTGLNNSTGIGFQLFSNGAADFTFKGEKQQSGIAYKINLQGSELKTVGSDQNGNSSVATYNGNVYETYNASKNITVAGSYKILVQGSYEESFLGRKVENFAGDKQTTFGGGYSDIVVGPRSSNYASGQYITIAKPDPVSGGTAAKSLKILMGDNTMTMLLGSYRITLLAGNIDETITLGNRNCTVVAGNINNTVVTGNINNTVTLGNINNNVITGNINLTTITGNVTMSSTAGNVVISALAGTLNLTGTAAINITSTTAISLTAPFIKLGTAPLGGTVVGVPSGIMHLDYVTNLPLLGVSTVMAGP